MGWNTVLRFTLNFTLSLAMVLGYVAIGAVVFVSLEWKDEQDRNKEARNLLQNFVDKYNLTEENKTDFIESFTAMNKLTKGHVHGLVNPREYETVWTFEGAFYFCTTAITTIGTGNITPNTSSGRWFCIAYVMIGIPLLTLFFGMSGYYFTQLLRLSILKIEGCTRIRMKLFMRQLTFALITWVLGTVSLCLYALWMYKSISDWSFGESIYFSLTTFSTIGFGDYANYNGSGSEFPLVISSFVVLTLMLPASSLLFSTTAELIQTVICPVYIKSGLVKKTELQRILAEDQLLYRYRKMKKEMQKYDTFKRARRHGQHDTENLLTEEEEEDKAFLHDSSLGYGIIKDYLDDIESDDCCSSCDDPFGTSRPIDRDDGKE